MSEDLEWQLPSITYVSWANKEHVTETTSPQKKTKPQKQPKTHPKENSQMLKKQSVRTPSWPWQTGGSNPPGISPICRVGSWQAEPGSLTIGGNSLCPEWPQWDKSGTQLVDICGQQSYSFSLSILSFFSLPINAKAVRQYLQEGTWHHKHPIPGKHHTWIWKLSFFLPHSTLQ
jgi:hypothetical protein